MKISAVSGKIHIYYNWSATKTAGICTGSGTKTDPYIIEDLEIDGGGSGSCILIENSNVYFKIENCMDYNSGNAWADAGIRLYNVDNGKLIDDIIERFKMSGVVNPYISLDRCYPLY